ncbi:uncharacterized protein [Nicotiana tomentosiformis]|uniref:uncharacterized protein n=1 Tax=Nicotiana tomentosiformis TaxID=4098 RepID=UPI00388C7B2C
MVVAWGESADDDDDDENEKSLMAIGESDEETEVSVIHLKNKIKLLSKERLSELLLELIDESEDANHEKEQLSKECVILKVKCKNLELRVSETVSENTVLKNQVHTLNSIVLELRYENLKLKLGTGPPMLFHGYTNTIVETEEVLALGTWHLSGIPKASTSHFLRTRFSHTVVQVKGSSQIWYMDSGCSKHMTGIKNQFLSLEDLKGGNVSFGNGKKAKIIGGKRANNIYVVNLSILSDNEITCLSELDNDPLLWHKRLGHDSLSQLNKLVSKDLVIGIPNIKLKENKVCEVCARGKQVRSSFKSKKMVSTTRTMELVHMDLCGPMRILSRGGKRYVMMLVYDYSRFTWTLFLTSKDEAFDMFTSFVRKTQKQLEESVHVVFDKTNILSERQEYDDEIIGLDADWVNAMQDKLNQFERSQAWHLVPRPKDRSVIGTKWAFRNKLDEDGTITRNTARLVVQGYSSEEVINYDETFAPVARLEAIRLLIAFVAYMEFTLHQMDVKSAFLNGYLKEKVFVKQLPGFKSKECPDHVYKLDKLSKEFAKLMGSGFEMSMMGELNVFLGLQIKQNSNGTMIHQQKYVKELLKRFKIEDSKEIGTPIETTTKLDVDEPGSFVDQKLYRGMIGSSLYLTTSRPDIVFSVGLCARF